MTHTIHELEAVQLIDAVERVRDFRKRTILKALLARKPTATLLDALTAPGIGPRTIDEALEVPDRQTLLDALTAHGIGP